MSDSSVSMSDGDNNDNDSKDSSGSENSSSSNHNRNSATSSSKKQESSWKKDSVSASRMTGLDKGKSEISQGRAADVLEQSQYLQSHAVLAPMDISGDINAVKDSGSESEKAALPISVVQTDTTDNKTLASSNVRAEQEVHLTSPAVFVKLPRVNCPEKIILCIDLNEEMNQTTFLAKSGVLTGLQMAKKAFKMFVHNKSHMNSKNEFAICIFQEDSVMIQGFTARVQTILNALDDIQIAAHESGPLNLSGLFETISQNVELPQVKENIQVIPPPFVLRLILLFGRSHCVPVMDRQPKHALEASPYFFTDVLYIHNPPTAENNVEEIFNILCQLDHNDTSYILEEYKTTTIMNSMAKLLAHPLQRPPQSLARYKLGSLAPRT